ARRRLCPVLPAWRIHAAASARTGRGSRRSESHADASGASLAAAAFAKYIADSGNVVGEASARKPESGGIEAAGESRGGVECDPQGGSDADAGTLKHSRRALCARPASLGLNRQNRFAIHGGYGRAERRGLFGV